MCSFYFYDTRFFPVCQGADRIFLRGCVVGFWLERVGRCGWRALWSLRLLLTEHPPPFSREAFGRTMFAPTVGAALHKKITALSYHTRKRLILYLIWHGSNRLPVCSFYFYDTRFFPVCQGASRIFLWWCGLTVFGRMWYNNSQSALERVHITCIRRSNPAPGREWLRWLGWSFLLCAMLYAISFWFCKTAINGNNRPSVQLGGYF